MTYHYFSWTTSRLPVRVAPYNRFSPNLALLRLLMRALFGAGGGSGFVVRPIRGGVNWSAHAYGAAWDAYIVARLRPVAIRWLIANATLLGIQAIHDYENCRIWHIGRGWVTVRPSRTSGFGYKTHLHIEVARERWADDTPMNLRGLSLPDAPVVQPTIPDGLPVLHRVDVRPTNPTIIEATKRVQRAVGVAADGWFGPRTEAAVRAWQSAHHLVVDGWVGAQSWKAIIEAGF